MIGPNRLTAPTAPSAEPARSSDYAAGRASLSSHALPDLAAILQELNPLPRFTAFLGICDDGLPLLMDLQNPAPGSILVCGDGDISIHNMLGVLISSVAKLNCPGDVQVALISVNERTYTKSIADRHLIRCVDPCDSRAIDLLGELEVFAKRPWTSEPIKLLIIDDLEAFSGRLDQEGQATLGRLIKNGPQFGFWVIAALQVDRATLLEDEIVQLFGTRLLGWIESPGYAEYLAGIDGYRSSRLLPGVQYRAFSRGREISFWIPRSEIHRDPDDR